jgi:tetratricopeptide (TPR) repeat protein
VHLIGGANDVQAEAAGSARAHVAAQQQLDTGSDALQLSWQRALAGEIALSEGRFAEAESAFQSAAPPILSVGGFGIQPGMTLLASNLSSRDGLARIKAARGDLKGAVEIYRRLNQPDTVSPWNAVLEPRFVLAAARLANRAGDSATAKAEYARFLDLWKDADPGLPEVTEARRSLRR